jgi:hypothetical protein
VFSGTVTETGSGLAIDTIVVAADEADDPSNVISAINPDTGTLGATAITLPVSTAGALDGDLSFSFSQQPTVSLPSLPGGMFPDHIVDWVIKAGDLAGNIGLSDVAPDDPGVQLPTVRIDRVLPAFVQAFGHNITGRYVDGNGNEVFDRSAVRVRFSEFLLVSNVNASDFVVALDDGSIVVPVEAVAINGAGSLSFSTVYLKLPVEMVSNETPTVFLQDVIQDAAGNSTANGLVALSDGLGRS